MPQFMYERKYLAVVKERMLSKACPRGPQPQPQHPNHIYPPPISNNSHNLTIWATRHKKTTASEDTDIHTLPPLASASTHTHIHACAQVGHPSIHLGASRVCPSVQPSTKHRHSPTTLLTHLPFSSNNLRRPRGVAVVSGDCPGRTRAIRHQTLPCFDEIRQPASQPARHAPTHWTPGPGQRARAPPARPPDRPAAITNDDKTRVANTAPSGTPTRSAV